jgi:hypothetical protein
MGINMTKLVSYADRISFAVIVLMLAAFPIAGVGFIAHSL